VAAHLKLIQYPARFGNGACFSATEVEPELAERLAALLDHLGYRGIFEAEFVGPPGDRQLIDLNPRAYNGMALETVRGLDSAWCAYLEAIGDTEALSRELAAAHSLSSDERLTCRDNTVLWTIVIGRTLAGGFSPREGWRWARWAWRTRKTAIDPLFASGDRRPGFAYVGHHLVSMVRHPRRFMGTYVLQGPEH
jgi:predicted ATP-grasp superfamily ATP-dependent carboligase